MGDLWSSTGTFCDRNLHQRDGKRLAAGQSVDPSGGHGGDDLRGVLSYERRLLGNIQLFRHCAHQRILRRWTKWRVPADGAAPTSGGNGVYAYGTGSIFPTNSFNASNYWVDVVLNPFLPPPQLYSCPVPSAQHCASGPGQPLAYFRELGRVMQKALQGLVCAWSRSPRLPHGSPLQPPVANNDSGFVATNPLLLVPNTPCVATPFTASLLPRFAGFDRPACCVTGRPRAYAAVLDA